MIIRDVADKDVGACLVLMTSLAFSLQSDLFLWLGQWSCGDSHATVPIVKNFQFSGFVIKAKTCFASFPEFFDEACLYNPLVLFKTL